MLSLFVCFLLLVLSCTPACRAESTLPITIQAGTQTFQAVLYDTPTGRQFYNSLPQTFPMTELNGNEKYYYMSTSLPTASAQVGTIHAGDLMLYGSTCVVLFYESFSTPYSYTKLGYVTNPQGLKSALGAGNVTVRFSAATKRGDVDRNGEVNLRDVVLIKRYLAGGYGVFVEVESGDANNDGAITLMDAVWITRALAGGYGITL